MFSDPFICNVRSDLYPTFACNNGRLAVFHATAYRTCDKEP
jgi:hypothetical protein